MKYNPQKIEKKWQNFWEKKGFYRAQNPAPSQKRLGPKFYILVEFPYPSGDGLHVGHVRSYTALDAVARKKRMQGFNVLYPMGWDAFGLPAENYAIKTGIHPSITVKKNIANFKRQMKSLGLSFDWEREINTTDPKYYKWTQWIFLQLFKNGLAYKKKMPINWCPSCKIGLANEEVVDGECERCGAQATIKEKEQWMLKITKYADRLIKDLDKVNYLEKIKAQQINWIGKSFGTEVDFKLEKTDKKITVFTTRIDTIFGATAVVISPENPLVQEITKKEKETEVKRYIKQSKQKSEFERINLEKTGVFTGAYCINPLNNEKVPIWVGDYVVAAYGGGAVMMVPAHDARDYQFAKKYELAIKEVVSGGDIKKEAFTDYGALINSGEFDGLSSEKAIKIITQWLEQKKLGRKTIQYKLRDWVFSRQHYWGEPIPIIHCKKCGQVPVLEKDLPVKLPFVKKYQPTGTGESPLAAISSWIKVKCPKCKGPAKRETDTMPNWAGSSWYFMRYLDPKNDKKITDPKKLKYWIPVDWYNGGMEHTTLHLLYSRFWYKFLYDIKVVPQSEPYAKRTSHGIILAQDSRKMSKSWGNVINPDDIIKQYGADSLRLYEMFMGPFDQMIAWDTKGIIGVRRFLDRFWNLVLSCINNKKSNKEIQSAFNKLIKKITEDLDNAKFNTAVAAFMEFSNLVSSNQDKTGKDVIEKLLILFAPFASHITEELWSLSGFKKSVHLQKWPVYNPKLIKEEKITLVIQINGKVRDKIEVAVDISENKAKEIALSQEKIKKWIADKKIKKVVFIKNKLINIVV
ncbi:leucine--tRNA ligase [Patescibacteria group bacterium]|nr:leucine--tRNA ligase [Patescibacteria group bacterium]MBU4367436.1 leucine--tRNA ligase [Patescibacteria group bacterium]MBU4461756.1 leucine--tRNA ligase [Patescibacteria group bacterium]MCG2700140.1 leucine--tRNA ligase [Candidatus Parcubacteria bacterium]